MNKAKRQAVIAGNWKMNKTRPEAKALIEELKPLVKDADCGVVICVPYTNLETALEATRGSSIKEMCIRDSLSSSFSRIST